MNLAPSPASSTSESPSTRSAPLVLERLRLSGPDLDLSFGPALTVVAGLDPGDRARVIDAVAGVMAGRCSGLQGSVLVEGVRFEIEDDLAGLLDLAGAATANVVRRQDIEAAVARALESAAPAPMTEDDFLLEAMAEDLAVRRQAILEAIEEERAAEPPVVEVEPTAVEITSEALTLADRAADLRARSAGVTVATVPEWLRTQTLEQLEEARAEVARLESEQEVRGISAEDAAALEAAHAAVDEAEDKATKRFASVLSKRRLEAARAAELEVLERLGIPSYATFVMQQATGAIVDPRNGHRLAAAKAALADAEAVAAAVEARAGDPTAAAFKAEELELRTAAAGVLGPQAAVALSDIGLERLEGLLRKHHDATATTEPAPVPTVEDVSMRAMEKPSKFDGELAALDHEEAWLQAERHWRRAAARVEDVLTRRIEAQRGVPVVIDDALAGQPHEVVERAVACLAALASATQIVYLAEGTDVARLTPPVAGDEVAIVVL